MYIYNYLCGDAGTVASHKSDWSLKLTSGNETFTPALEMSISLCTIFTNRLEFKLLVINTWFLGNQCLIRNVLFLKSLSLVFCRKDLCEARVKPKMSSNLADKPSLANVPPFETVMSSRSLIG